MFHFSEERFLYFSWSGVILCKRIVDILGNEIFKIKFHPSFKQLSILFDSKIYAYSYSSLTLFNVLIGYFFATIQIDFFHIIAVGGQRLHRGIPNRLATSQAQFSQKTATSLWQIFNYRTLSKTQISWIFFFLGGGGGQIKNDRTDVLSRLSGSWKDLFAASYCHPRRVDSTISKLGRICITTQRPNTKRFWNIWHKFEPMTEYKRCLVEADLREKIKFEKFIFFLNLLFQNEKEES